jgi:hypothetical protein
MIDGGNTYEVLAAKLTDSESVVVVRETKRSPDQACIASFPSYLQKKIGDFDLDDPMEINEELRMEDDMAEMAPEPMEAESMKSILRGDFSDSDEDSNLRY